MLLIEGRRQFRLPNVEQLGNLAEVVGQAGSGIAKRLLVEDRPPYLMIADNVLHEFHWLGPHEGMVAEHLGKLMGHGRMVCAGDHKVGLPGFGGLNNHGILICLG